MKISFHQRVNRTKQLIFACCFRLIPKISVLTIIYVFILTFDSVYGDQVPATISAPNTKAWVGQRLPFFIELHTRGSFQGSPTFAIPQIPGTVILKVGNPIVSSKKIDGQDWFTQRHEYAVFSQREGALIIPAIPIRFSFQDGFTGPVKDIDVKSDELILTIQRPPSSKEIDYLITTDSLEITERWEPEPNSAEVGSVFKRTIKQRASQMTGMALAPAPTQAPEGTRLYPSRAEVTDKTDRGDFLGERSEIITYLIEKPGTIILPGITFNWWNPETQTLESKTLPAVTFEVPAPPAAPVSTSSKIYSFWPWLLTVVLITIGIWQRKRINIWVKSVWKVLNPPDRVAARKLIHACRRNDAVLASLAWAAWRETRSTSYQPDEDLQLVVLTLQRYLFGPPSQSNWQGDDLARAFLKQTQISLKVKFEVSSLPPLNP
jgi:hypothetical protein